MFDALQSEIYDLLEAANAVLPENDALFYGGRFLSGRIERPEFLFLGINPGQGHWAERKRVFPREDFVPGDCKFIEEHEDGAPLAGSIVDVVLNGQVDRLAACAESSVRSFYATPDVGTLDRQCSHLNRAGLLNRHNALIARGVDLILDQVQPHQIVCIGMTSFGVIEKRFGLRDIAMKSERSASGLSDPVYYKRADYKGIPIHGVLHLSGGRPSRTMLADLKRTFAELMV